MKMLQRSNIKFAALVGLGFSVASLIVHLYIANFSSNEYLYYTRPFDGFYGSGFKFQRLWGPISELEFLQPYSDPREEYHVPSMENNGYVYAKISGGFENIQSSIADLVVIARLLNATLVIPEIQASLQSKGVSSKFKSFGYIYNEAQFITALSKDVIVVRNLPLRLKESKKNKDFPMMSPDYSASPGFYLTEVLPMLKSSEAVGLNISGGGCLQSILPPAMAEYQRLRCRVAFNALEFRKEIKALGNQIIDRLRTYGQPYIAYHPGLARDALAFHGCAELFQDVHTELIQYRRRQMIKRGILSEGLNVDSRLRRKNGSCPLMPEEVGLLLRAIGYPPNTVIYVAGSDIFGGQRVFIPLHAMYVNVVDRTTLCSKDELSQLVGPESPLPEESIPLPHTKSEEELVQEWKNAGPRPRPLPPPPARPILPHEQSGWYGWINAVDKEPNPSQIDLRENAHRLVWDAVDFMVSVEADAYFPGFHGDGRSSPDFSSLVMGQRLYRTPSATTYRPDRKVITELFDTIRDNLYRPKRNWTVKARDHLKKSLGLEGLLRDSQKSKSTSFLAHPLPECSCRIAGVNISAPVNGSLDKSSLLGEEEVCPIWMAHDHDPLAVEALESISGEEETDAEVDVEPDNVSTVGEANSMQAEEIESDD